MTAELVEGLSFQRYCEIDGWNQSSLKRVLEDSLDYKFGQRKETTKAMWWGKHLEDFVMGNDVRAVEAPLEVLKSNGSKKQPEWDEFQAEHPDCEILKPGEYDLMALDLMDADNMIRRHKTGSIVYADDAIKHPVLCGELHGFFVKAQLDFLVMGDTPIIIDLKTARDVKPHLWKRDAVQFGYHIQSWFYTALLGQYLDIPWWEIEFRFVVSKNRPHHDCAVFNLSFEFMRCGEELVAEAFRRIKHNQDSGDWRSPTAQSGRVIMLDAPEWMKNEYLK